MYAIRSYYGHKISELQSGKIPIYEPGLQNLVQKNVREKRLKFDTDAGKAVPWAVITSYSIHYTKLYDGEIAVEIFNAVFFKVIEMGF